VKTNNWKSDGVKPPHCAKRDWLFDVSAQFVRHASVSLGARFLFVLIKSYQGADGALPFPSLELLCDLTGRNRKTVQKYISELEDAGYAFKKRERGSNGRFGSIHYVLSWQPQVKKLPVVQPKAQKPQVVLPQVEKVPYIISHFQHLPR
jgi:hypothetical protein